MSTPPQQQGNGSANYQMMQQQYAAQQAQQRQQQYQFAQQQQQQQQQQAQQQRQYQMAQLQAQQQQQQQQQQLQQQQRQQQQQQQQPHLPSKGSAPAKSSHRGILHSNSPLAPAPASLARPPSLQSTTTSSSTASMARTSMSSSASVSPFAKTKSASSSCMAPKTTTTANTTMMNRGVSSSSANQHHPIASASSSLSSPVTMAPPLPAAAQPQQPQQQQPPSTPPTTTLKSATTSSFSVGSGSSGGALTCTGNDTMTQELLAKCDWIDKTIWVSRQLLGGNSNNGFLFATSNVQRIKRQRARQVAQNHKKNSVKDDDPTATSNTTTTAASPPPTTTTAAATTKDSKDDFNLGSNHGDGSVHDSKEGGGSAGKKRDAHDQAAEEALKKEVMNPRTAKKLRAELEHGVQFCLTLHNAIRSILQQMDPEIACYTPLPLDKGGSIPIIHGGSGTYASKQPPQPQSFKSTSSPVKAISSTTTTTTTPTSPLATGPPNTVVTEKASNTVSPLAPSTVATAVVTATAPQPKPQPPKTQQPQRRASDSSFPAGNNNKKKNSTASQASPGGPGGSTLRKHRKKKLPPTTGAPVILPEFDPTGKRVCSKKEHSFRIFEAIRFRALKEGDFVAARVSSRDLWILARVQTDYPGFSMPAADFLQLTEARRDATFKDKVAIKDVEDKDGAIQRVPRNLILPLPRTYSEAAEWGQRSKKGSRVYAMYPHTTSLYSATVIDNTTYCRDDDDIIVVEFDGDEADASGALPKYHIPARFVTLIPREFPAAQTNSSTNTKKRKSATAAQPSSLQNSANDLASPSSVKSMKSEGSLQGSGLLDYALDGMVQGMGFGDLDANDSLEDFGFDFNEETL